MESAALTHEVASLRFSDESLSDSSEVVVGLSGEVAEVWWRELETRVARLRVLWNWRNCSTVGWGVSSTAAELNSANILQHEIMHHVSCDFLEHIELKGIRNAG